MTLFTNGQKSDLVELLELPDVSIAGRNTDITDLILMSRANYLIASAWSSFSYLAGYLGNAVLIRHPYANSCRIRAASSAAFEGTLAEYSSQLRKAG